MQKFNSIDAYIASFPKEMQVLLQEMRAVIKKAAPKAEEVISYGMPAFKQKAVLIYFAGYKNHLGVYPTSSGIAAFAKELTMYKTSKGALQLPLDKPIPKGLITRVVKHRIKVVNEKEKLKAKKKINRK